MDTPPLLAARGLRCSWGGPAVITDLSMDVRHGEVLGIIGPNGCGKSTLLAALTGYLAPSGGEVLLDGRPLREFSHRARARRLGHVAQRPSAGFPFRVRELVEMGRYAAGDAPAAVDAAMALLEVGHLADRPITRLSGGELQRAWLARAWAGEPDCLLLDEPTAALDLRHQVKLLEALRRRTRGAARAAVAVLHDLNLAAGFCDRLLLMDRGRAVACGAPAEVLQYPVLREVYGTDLYIGLLDGLDRLFVLPLSEEDRPGRC